VLGPIAIESAEQDAAFARAYEALGKEPRRGIQAAMVKEFFGAGSQDGPFPGARSAQGEWMASTFYSHVKAGGQFATLKPSGLSESGYRLHNFNRMG